MTKKTVRTLAYKCNDCDRYPRFYTSVGCWNDDYVCNCSSERSPNRINRLIHRTHMGWYVDNYGLPKCKDSDDPEIADPIPPKE